MGIRTKTYAQVDEYIMNICMCTYPIFNTLLYHIYTLKVLAFAKDNLFIIRTLLH